MAKVRQAFDWNELPPKLHKRMSEELREEFFSGNNSYKTMYMDDLKEDNPELYKWLVKSGYEKEKNLPSGNCVLLIYW